MMKNNIFGFIMICLLVFITGCGNPTKNVKITEKNKDTVFEQIKNSKDLTADEVRMFMAYVLRSTITSAFSGEKKLSYEGKTIGEIINEELKLEKEKNKLAEEARKEDEALAKQLSSTVLVEVYKKGFIPAEYSSGSYDDYISLSLAIQNICPKEIRAFKGKLVVKDLFGTLIKNYVFDSDKKLKPNQKMRGTFYWSCNKFNDDDEKIKATSLDSLKITWQPIAIIYSDGTKIGKFED